MLVRRSLALLVGLAGLTLALEFQSLRGCCLWLWLLTLAALLATSRCRLRPAVVVFCCGVLGFTLTSPGGTGPGEGVRSTPPGWWRWSPLNWVSEGEWSELGVHLLLSNKAERILGHARPLYARQRHPLAHTATLTALDLVGLGPGPDHLFYYAPEGPPRPLLIFLHGAMGNLQCYAEFWRQFCDRYGYSMVCPTFGFGYWQRPEGLQRALLAYEFAHRELSVLPGPALWIGLSNGAMGAVRVARHRPQLVGQLVLISPVLEPAEVGHLSMNPLVLSGARDSLTWPRDVQLGVEAMKKAGLAPDLRWFPKEDHFLMFQQQETVFQAIIRLRETDAGRGRAKGLP